MSNTTTVLSHNIRTLRKAQKLSQEELATQLGIKRSNIAAYESKNVEPRLRVILEIARLFDINVKSLIEKKLTDGQNFPRFEKTAFESKYNNIQTFDIDNNVDIKEFIEKSVKIRKVLEGFKAFYSFKKNKIAVASPDQQKLAFDIDNFIQLMDHLLAYNETVIKAISNSDEFGDSESE